MAELLDSGTTISDTDSTITLPATAPAQALSTDHIHYIVTNNTVHYIQSYDPATKIATMLNHRPGGFSSPAAYTLERASLVAPDIGEILNLTGALVGATTTSGSAIFVDVFPFVCHGGANALYVSRSSGASSNGEFELLVGPEYKEIEFGASGVSAIGNEIMHSDTAQAGGATSITLATSAPSNDIVADENGLVSVRITGGTGINQIRFVTAYDGGTKLANTSGAWTITPDATSTYELIRGRSIHLASDAPVHGLLGAQIEIDVVHSDGAAKGKGRYTIRAYDPVTKIAEVTAGPIDNFANSGDAVNAGATYTISSLSSYGRKTPNGILSPHVIRPLIGTSEIYPIPEEHRSSKGFTVLPKFIGEVDGVVDHSELIELIPLKL